MTEELDLRGEVCPYTFVKTKLRLEELDSGQDLTILLDDSAATANVSRSLRSEGHEILDLKALSGEVWQIVVKKNEIDLQ
ncbi:MAG: sulfurtransferase TusA family protein [Methanothrix sp.]|nr:sulfurtransferase TusA family protein [Methanothrix sp.]